MEFEEVLNFWFGKPETEGYGQPRQFWFVKQNDVDQEIKSRFYSIYQLAAKGKLDFWQETPLSCLALIVVLDQFPRNMFRGKPQAFATDTLALKFAQYALSQNYDQQLLPVQRWFIYLPFEHSENFEHQQTAVNLFSTLKDDPNSARTIEYAIRHLEIIERFGRFPHRNQILGRESTPEELEFLSQPGSKF
ncbi:hypothetical protein STA3757_22390 [Stanieria sp. NIES-3757]|nr:hypothetical protein STA3757_22390 [Stanieria sp. NIES-3757]